MIKLVEKENNVIPIPQLSEVDKQYITIEKQQELIREQKRLIDERKF